MADDERARFVLPRGASGFLRPADGPLPEVDLPTLRSALYAGARAAGGTLVELTEQRHPRTFHTATVIDGSGECVILCYAHHPWIACARERRDWYAEEFLDPPPWAHALSHLGGVLFNAWD